MLFNLYIQDIFEILCCLCIAISIGLIVAGVMILKKARSYSAGKHLDELQKRVEALEGKPYAYQQDVKQITDRFFGLDESLKNQGDILFAYKKKVQQLEEIIKGRM
ncbi:MAG: hypothetical protein IJS50_05815 [Desulfovibrio sp.]|nr:hypothetical protein [Desulfovibrio sp.]